MLTGFDWLRRCVTGAELLAVLRMRHEDQDCFAKLATVAGRDWFGPVPNALTVPCARCWLYPRLPSSIYCPICRVIRDGTRNTGMIARDALVVWGYVNQLPAQLQSPKKAPPAHLLGVHTPDEQHFLAMVRRRELHPWLQELVLYHGTELRGHIQIFPTMGADNDLGMGDIVCRAIRHETYLDHDKLRVRFFTRPYQVLRPHEMDREGLLTFDVAEFISLLEMASVFRSLLMPADQEMLFELLTMPKAASEMFYWGRAMGALNQRARDLLEAWQMRSWPANRVKFFYELLENVDYQPAA